MEQARLTTSVILVSWFRSYFRDQKNARSNLIVIWNSPSVVYDLVTMQWFNYVGWKQCLPTLYAIKLAGNKGEQRIKICWRILPRAYAVDRAGANPIRQPLSNLRALAGPLFIIKAPVMMQATGTIDGCSRFQERHQGPFEKYSFENATRPDAIKLLDDRTPVDLQAWNRVWQYTGPWLTGCNKRWRHYPLTIDAGDKMLTICCRSFE